MTTRSEWRERWSGESTRYGDIGGLVCDAMRRDGRAIDELVEKLLDPDTKLTPDDKSWLALIVKNLPRGRPRGLTPERYVTMCGGYVFRIGKQHWCLKHGRERATNKTLNEKMLKRTIELMEELLKAQFPEEGRKRRSKIKIDEVKEESNRTPSAVVLEEAQHLSKQLAEIIKIALEE